MDFKRVGSFVLLTVMSSPLLVWAGSQLLKVSTNTEKIHSIETDITEQKVQIKEIHWFLIKRNKVQVPKGK